MKKLWYSFTKELKLASKSFYFYIEFVMAFLIIFVLLFMIPEEMVSRDDEYLYLNMPEEVKDYYIDAILEDDTDGVLEKTQLKLGKDKITVDMAETDDSRIHLLPDEQMLITLTKDDRPAAAAVVKFNPEIEDFEYDYYLQGYESERLKNLYRIIHIRDVRDLWDLADEVGIQSLGNYDSLNSREMAVPSLLTFNGALMGMFIIAAYIFIDKDEGIIKAYAVTASKVWQYMMSKILVMTLVTIVTTFAITIAVMGSSPNYLMLLVLLIPSSFAASSLGLVISSFYDNMTKAFAVIYVIMILMMLPAIAYFTPSWQPLWITLIPTHPLIQGFKEIVITGGDMVYVASTALIFLIAGMILFVFANYRFNKNLAA